MLKRLAVFLLCATSCGTYEAADHAAFSETTSEEALSSDFFPALGKGVNLAETKTYGTCVLFTPPPPAPATFEQRSFETFNIKSRSELNEKLNISASVAAKSLWGSASAKYSHFDEVKLESTYNYWVARARYELAHESINTAHPEFKLGPQAQKLLTEQGWPAFKQVCGTQFYVGRTLGAQYTILYELTDAKARRTSIGGANVDASAFGISASANFDKSIARAHETQTLRIYVSIAGGDASVSMNVTDTAGLRTELDHLATSLSNRNGRTLEWETLSYDYFPEVIAAKSQRQEDLTIHDIEQSLANFYNTYTSNEAAIAQLQLAQTRSEGEDRWHEYTIDQLTQIQSRIQALTTQNTTIAHQAAQCMETPTHTTCNPPLAPINREVPNPTRTFDGVAPWELHIANEPGDSQLIQYIGLRPGGRFPRHFHVGAAIYNTRDGLFALAPRTEGTRFIKIGQTASDEWGVPQVCVNAFASVCSLRIIERRGFTDRDGLPSVKLLLTMFDEDGYESRKYEFFPSP